MAVEGIEQYACGALPESNNGVWAFGGDGLAIGSSTLPLCHNLG